MMGSGVGAWAMFQFGRNKKQTGKMTPRFDWRTKTRKAI